MWNKRDSRRIDFYVVFHVDIEAKMYMGATSHRIITGRKSHITATISVRLACVRLFLHLHISEIEN